MAISQSPEPAVVDTVEAIWGAELKPAGCAACDRVYLVKPDLAEQVCPGCGKAVLNPQTALLRQEPPEVMIPNSVSRHQLDSILKEFVRGVWLHSDDFSASSLLGRASSVFIPMWLVDSDINGIWQAEAGFDYEVKSSEEYYAGGAWRSREKIETRIKWEPRTGQLQRHYDNVASAATSDFREINAMVGGFDYRKGQGYTPDRLENDFLRVPDVHPDSAWGEIKSSLERLAAIDCQKASGAQHIRDFSIKAEYEELNWTQLLIPLIITWYTDDSGEHQMVYINGQNGKVGGLRLASQRKGWKWAAIIAGIAMLFLLGGLLLLALGTLFPPVMVFGVILIVMALILGVAAAIPAAWPWQWNRRQKR